VQGLKTVLKERAVMFVENITAHMNCEVRRQPNDETVERGMMQFTESDSIADFGLSLWCAVGHDVSRVK
jgi:hypothetical protein